MITRYISDEDLIVATALVSDSMLRALPEPEDCVGQFSKQFEERIEKLKKATVRKIKRRNILKSAVVAILTIIVAFSMLCTFNTEVRAAVSSWFKETFGVFTTYWFTSETDVLLPEYELTWAPEGYEIVFEETYDQIYGSVYQRGNNVMDSFTFDCYIATDDMQLTIQSMYGSFESKTVDINGQYGEFYLSNNPADTNTLVWFGEENDVVFIITSYLDQQDILHIAESVKLEK